MQHDDATGMRHGGLRTFAVKVLGRNTTARQACNTASDDVLHRDATHDTPMQHFCDTPEPTAKPAECPYTLPEGVKLVQFTRKAPPVAVTVCSVVTDIPKFVRHALAELDARLHHPVQIKAGDSVFELLSKLGDCGLELRLEWPPEPIIQTSPEGEPSKPAKPPATPDLNAHGVDITDEDVAF
jgi:hypothetical protein